MADTRALRVRRAVPRPRRRGGPPDDRHPDLTARQRQVLAALRRLSERDGVAPTLRELADEVGFASPTSVLHHVRVLEARELVVHRAGRARTLRLASATSDPERGWPAPAPGDGVAH